MICCYVDFYFLTMKASTSQPGLHFPISEFLVQQQAHSQPIWSWKNAKEKHYSQFP